MALATVGVVVACDTVPLTSPTGSSITLSVDRSVLPLGGQATVTAVVTESAGTAVHNGTVVTFQTTVGTLSPVEAETLNGVATTQLIAGQSSGVATINAFSGGARTGSGNASSGGVQVRIGAAAASGNISVSATPPSVSQSGGTVTISALVFDEARNPLPGVNVQFVASTGTLSVTTSNTDSGGIARTLLTTATTATVNAFAGSATGSTQVTVSAAPNVEITADSTGTEGVPFPITVSFTAAATGSPQVQSVTVDFGDGTSDTRNNVTGTVGFSHTYRPGGYTITATARDVTGNTGIASKAITIQAAALPTVSMSVTPNPVPPVNGGLTNITVTAAAGSTSPLRNVTVRNMTSGGEVIYSGTSGGTFAHRFGGTGTYTLQASATDANGNTGTTTTVVVVQ